MFDAAEQILHLPSSNLSLGVSQWHGTPQAELWIGQPSARAAFGFHHSCGLAHQPREAHQRERNTPRFGETLMLSAKQMDNALRRFASGIPAALALIEHGLCSKVSKKRYAELIKTRASRLDF